MNKELITEKLLAAGIEIESLDWRLDWQNNTYLRYCYWTQLPIDAWNAVKEFMDEDIYDDDDGDDYNGRPIIIQHYSYHIKK
jgi:hypothetical protein